MPDEGEEGWIRVRCKCGEIQKFPSPEYRNTPSASFECNTCYRTNVFKVIDGEIQYQELQEFRLRLLTTKLFDEHNSLFAVLSEAERSLSSRAIRASVAMCRLALEIVLHYAIGFDPKETLPDKINKAEKKGYIDEAQSKQAHYLRLVGKNAVHEYDLTGEINPIPDLNDARSALLFVESVASKVLKIPLEE